MGVGAHRTHVTGGALSGPIACAQCHSPVRSFADASHIDGDDQAEVRFGDLAAAGGATPQFDGQTGTCAGTYCHGGGRFGSGQSVVWTQAGQGAAACGTCHGLPPSPATGHPAVPPGIPCSLCHTNVDTQLRIVDSALHINHQTEVSCGTCHGLPPQTDDHPQSSTYLDVTKCSMCHSSVIDDSYHFINQSLHGNGEVDF
jgi:predicted CxxxxCH...CXXCH cytochrome family protein